MEQLTNYFHSFQAIPRPRLDPDRREVAFRISDRLPAQLLNPQEALRRSEDQGDGRILRVHARRRVVRRKSGLERKGDRDRQDLVHLADGRFPRTSGGEDSGTIHLAKRLVQYYIMLL